MSVGMLGYLGVGVESSVAGAAGINNSATIVDYIPIISETLQATREDLDSQELRQSWDQVKVYNGIQRVGGQINVEAHPISFGYLLRNAFDVTTAMNGLFGAAAGVVGAQASNATVRTHRFTTGTTQFQAGSGSDVPTMTYEVNRGPGFDVDSSFYYYRCAGNTLEISQEAGQLARGSLDVIGGDFEVAAKTSPSFPAADAFLWHQGSVTLDAVAGVCYESLTVRLNNNMEPVTCIGGGLRTEQVKRNNFRQVEVNGALSFTGFTEYDQFRNGSEGQLVLHIEGSQIDVLGDTDSLFLNVLRLDVPKFRYSTFPVNLAGPQRISVGFTGRGVLDTTSNYALEVMLTNTRTNAYTVNSNA